MEIKHAGLTVQERDVEIFYRGVMGFFIEGSFNLSEELATDIFDIKSSVDVYNLKKGQVILELFVYNAKHTKNVGFQHLCLVHSEAEDIYNKAKEKGYRTYLKQGKNKKTYFIKDQNNNIFELRS